MSADIKGMSNLSLYELGDIIWDEFDRGDDHIVPHPTNARSSNHSAEGDKCRKLQHETTVLSNTVNLDDSHTIFQQKEEKDSKPLDKKKKLMEKESPSLASHGVFNGSCEGEILKDMANLASDDIRMEDDCFKSSYATSATGDNNSYSYPLTQISQGDLCFADNNCEDKESGEIIYYNWSDIGNLKDVDKMLRSCDSSLWFTSNQIEGTEEAFKMDFKFQGPEPSGLKSILHREHDSLESNNHRSSCISESKNEINMQKKKSKHNNQTEGNDKGSFCQISDPRSNDNRPSSNHKSDQKCQQFDYFGHLKGNTCYLPPDYLHQTTSNPMLSGIKSEHKSLKSHSPMGSSYASNQSSGEPSIDERKQFQGFQSLFVGSPRQKGMMFQSSKGVLVSDEKQGKLLAKEHGSQKNIDRVQKRVDISLLNVQESSSVSYELDEISLESTSLRQLQQATEQLDLRTKLCIRDSLYRLARSAKQRHNNNNPSLGSGAMDVNDLGGPLMSERTNNGFMDMETDTNPIDRSVAHLLFHRPSESLNLPTFPPKHNLNHGSILTESRVCEEKVASGSNDTMGGDIN